jgi:hypothetical protein
MARMFVTFYLCSLIAVVLFCPLQLGAMPDSTDENIRFAVKTAWTPLMLTLHGCPSIRHSYRRYLTWVFGEEITEAAMIRISIFAFDSGWIDGVPGANFHNR